MVHFSTPASLRRSAVLLLFILAGPFIRAGEAVDYRWDLAPGFTPPPVPADNPMTLAKVELGRHLFYDKRLSGNGRQACASCHIQRLAFTDGKAFARGSTGESHPRGSMSLVNIAWGQSLTWNTPRAMTLEEQMLVPMFGTHPTELGVKPGGVKFLKTAQRDLRYQALFHEAYPNEAAPFTLTNVVRAIASFERTIHSARSDWDFDWQQLQRGSSENVPEPRTSAESRRGELLFFGDKMACGRCHGGLNFDSTFADDGAKETGPAFHNNGMPANTLGIAQHTGKADDMGKFKAPSMRNIAITAPYMHDGRFATLEEVIDHYAKGGSHSANQSPLVRGFTLSPQEKEDLLAFLRSLTDVPLTLDPRLSDPWPATSSKAAAAR